MWAVFITGPAKKQLKKIPKETTGRIRKILREIKADPFAGNVMKLADNTWRRRAGSYRIIFDVLLKEKMVLVLAILRRTSATY